MLSRAASLTPTHAVNRPCFVCGAEESEVRFRPDVRRWGYADPFILRRCSGCGLVFNSPRIPQEQLEQLYQRGYYFFARPAGREMERICGAYLRTIAHLPGKGGTLLEVGSGKGYMLGLLSRLGWQVAGVELAGSAAASSRRTFRVEVYQGTVEAYQRAQARIFDVVLAQDVIEHVPDPVAFLGALRESLRPGGILIVDTPNVGGRNVGTVGQRWRGFNPFHIYLYDRDTLTRALENSGFDIHLIGSYNELAPEASVTGARTPSPPNAGGGIRAWVSRSSLRLRGALRRGVDRVLLPHYMRRAARTVLSSPPLELDPSCGGDNLVCIAVRRA